jgi:hypothetical protein
VAEGACEGWRKAFIDMDEQVFLFSTPPAHKGLHQPGSEVLAGLSRRRSEMKPPSTKEATDVADSS